MDKLERLRQIIASCGEATVAYSGGADSAFLTDVAHEVLGARVRAVTAVSPSLAPSERDAAAALARERGWRHEEILTNELDRPGYRRNAPDRCYHCKTELFEVLESLDLPGVVMVGTNLDDTSDFRPGERAAREHNVRAPLLEAGLSKSEIRALSRARGLPTWDKPASPCLSSRIAYGIEVTPERLDRVAQAEEAVRALGIRDCRVRDHGDLARIEVPAAAVEQVAANRDTIAAALRGLGFSFVTVDLEGLRSGSLNTVVLTVGRKGE